MKRELKLSLACLFALGLTINSYAADSSSDNPCANSNPYTQQTCERLKISSDEARKAQSKNHENQALKNEEAIRQQLKNQNNASPTQTSPDGSTPQPPVPDWQKALSGQMGTQNQIPTQTAPVTENNSTQHASENNETDNPPSVTQLPPPEATQFSTPKPVTLPGAANIIPSKPQGTGNAKYY